MKRVLVPLLVTLVLVGRVAPAIAQSEFTATLSGANEIPAVAGIGSGSASFDVNISGNVVGINYELNVVNVTGAFMSHIHCGTADQNGPVIAYFAGPAPAPTGYDLNGAWVKAKLTDNAVIAGSTCGNTLFDLVTAMVEGRTYVNVHTRANPGGAVRGQIQLVAPFTIP